MTIRRSHPTASTYPTSRARSLGLAVTLLLASAPAAAQSASITPFGQGSNCGPAITTGSTTLPRLGSTIQIDYQGPNTYFLQQTGPDIRHPYLVLGRSNQSWGGVPLPWPLPPGLAWNQPTGATLYVSLDVLLPMPMVSPFAYATSVRFPIPNVPALIGVDVYAQFVTYHDIFTLTGPRSVFWCTGNALHLRLGI